MENAQNMPGIYIALEFLSGWTKFASRNMLPEFMPLVILLALLISLLLIAGIGALVVLTENRKLMKKGAQINTAEHKNLHDSLSKMADEWQRLNSENKELRTENTRLREENLHLTTEKERAQAQHSKQHRPPDKSR
ncbi:hypothetical protein [Ethanoligenens sp.]|uniref:hypothetical protein n=1 Tax=Ethanoligenens sp. TaxID=2099655 RepID=UPI0039E8F87A